MAQTQEFTTVINLNDAKAKETLSTLTKRVENLKKLRDDAISSKAEAKVVRDLNKQVKAAETELKAYKTKVSDIIHTVNNLGTASAEEIKTAMRALKRTQQEAVNPEEWNKMQTNIDKCSRRLVELQHNTSLVDATMKNLSGAKLKDLEATAKMLNAQLRETEQGTKEFKALNEQLEQVKSQIRDINDESKESTSLWTKISGAANKALGLFTEGLVVVSGIKSKVEEAVAEYSKMEESMANVRKYTGQTSEEVRAMNEDFKNMDTRLSRDQLNELAGAAGRLGKTSKEDIEGFVDAANKINVALGDDLGEGAVGNIGKLAMTFGEDKTKGLQRAMLATGSAVNELAQNSSAGAGYLVEFTSRVAGVGKMLGMSQADIMGFAAVLDESMQKDEMAATAFSQLLSKMASDTKTFAKLAGQDAKDFADLVKNDVNSAVVLLMENVGKQGGFEQMSKMFDNMGLDGSRALSVLTTIADKIQLVKERQTLANQAYNEGTSVISEFNVQNTTVQAGMDKAKKALNEIVIELGERLMPVARMSINAATLGAKALSELVKFAFNNIEALAALATGVATYTIALKIKNNEEKISLALSKAGFVMDKAWAITKGVLAGKISLVTVAQHALNKVMMMNPYIAVAAGVTALVYGFTKLIKSTTDTDAATRKLNGELKSINDKYNEQKKKIEELLPIAQDEQESTEKRKAAIEELKKIYPDYFKNLDLETAKQYELANALKVQNAERRKELQLKVNEAGDAYRKYLKEYEENRKADKAMSGAVVIGSTSNGTQSLMAAQEKAHLDDLRNAAEAAVKALTDFDNKTTQDPTIYKPTEAKGEQNTPAYQSEKEEKKRKQAEEKAKRERDKVLREAVKHQEALNNAEDAENSARYSAGIITYREYVKKQQELDLEHLDKQIEIYGKDSGEAQKLFKKKEELTQRYEKDRSDSEREILANAKSNAVALQLAYEDSNSQLYHNDAALQEALFQNEMNALFERRDLYKENSQEWLNIDAEIVESDEQHCLQLRQRYADMLATYRRDWARRDIAEEQTATLRGLEELHKQGLLSEEEYQQMKREIQLRYAQLSAEQDKDNSRSATISRNANTAYATAKASASAKLGNENAPSLGNFLMGDIDLHKNTMEKLKEMYGDDAESFEEYQQAKSLAFADMASGLGSKMQAAYDAILPLLNGMSSYWSAQSQHEQNVTSKKYDKLIEAAGNNSKKTKKLEEQKQKELAAIKTKYNKKAMKMELAQATATMVLGAMNAYTSAFKGAPYPANLVLAPIAAGIATAAGLLNIATIKKQHEAEAAGYYSGGFTGGSHYRREAGVVHEGEFVANHQAVANTRLLPALQLIDQAQRNNTVASLRAEDISRAVGGGQPTVVSAPTVNVMTDNSQVVETMNEARSVIDRLSTILANGLHAYTTIDGPGGHNEAMKKWNKLQENK